MATPGRGRRCRPDRYGDAGALRAAYFPGAREDPRWWVLGLYGLGRVDPDDPTTVHDVVRDGIGRYPRRIVDLGRDHLAIGTDLSGNVVLVAKDSGRPVGRLRLPRAAASRALGDGLIRVLAPEHGMVHDVDPTQPKVRRRHKIPSGMGARLVGDILYYLAGEVTEVPILTAGGAPTPGVPVVIGDGADADGNLAIGTQDGFALVAGDSGALLAEHVEPGGLVGAGIVPGRNAVVLARSGTPLGSVAVVTW